MALSTNKNYDNIPGNYIRSFDDEISIYDGILKFTLGEPDFDMADFVKESLKEAIDRNASHYAPTHGVDVFRQEIVHYLKRHYHLDYDPNRNILVTVGVTEGLSTAAHALLNPGEKVVFSSPYFTLYDNIVKSAYGVPLPIETAEDDFVLTAKKLDQVLSQEDQVKFVLLNYPNNPTGVSYQPEELQALAQVIENHDVYCVSDEVYSALTYDGFNHHSIAQYIPDRTIVLNGMSKAYAMTGLRLGYMAVPEDLLDTFYVVHQAAVTCVSTTSQIAAATALREGDEWVNDMRQAYAQRRNYLIPELERLGFELASPTGAFYLFLKIPAAYNQNDREFALELAKEARVGLIPGEAFGESGKGYLRLSYASSLEELQEGMQRLDRYFIS